MTAAPPAKTTTFKLDDIILDPEFQIREELDKDHVEYLADILRDGRELKPIDVFFLEGKPHGVDGFHRWNASKSAGRDQIEAIVHAGDRRDARQFAALANRGRGELKLRGKENQKSILWLIELKPSASNIEIADLAGCSHQYVARIRKPLSTAVESGPSIRVDRNGRPMDVSRIGKSSPARPTVAAGPLPKGDDKDVDTDNWPDGWRELTVFHVPTLSDDLRDKLKALNLDILGDLLREVKCNITEHGQIAEFQDEVVIALRAWNPAGDTTPSPEPTATEENAPPADSETGEEPLPESQDASPVDEAERVYTSAIDDAIAGLKAAKLAIERLGRIGEGDERYLSAGPMNPRYWQNDVAFEVGFATAHLFEIKELIRLLKGEVLSATPSLRVPGKRWTLGDETSFNKSLPDKYKNKN